MSGQSGGQRQCLSELNEQLTCKLCGGYFIDATTIIKCLHTFCKSCIVKYLENSKYCPTCEVQVHKDEPLLNIRPDLVLQDIVYKLVPGCYQNEMKCRKEFYSKHPEEKNAITSAEALGEPTESHIYSPDESLSLSLEYYDPEAIDDDEDDEKHEATTKRLPRRYLRCPAAVTVFHLQKLIRAKYGLSEAHKVDIMYKEEQLSANYTLMDIMYIHHWRRKVPLHLSYRIYESAPKRCKLSDDNNEFKMTLLNSGISSESNSSGEQTPKREWKEVQLKISETGVMSVTDISSIDTNSTNIVEIKPEQRSLDETILNVCNLDKPVITDKKQTKSKGNSKRDKKSDEGFKSANTRAAVAEKKTEAKTLSKKEQNSDKESAESVSSKPAIDSATTEVESKPNLQAASEKINKETMETDEKRPPDGKILTNNNSIKQEIKTPVSRANAKNAQSAGSKINALSAKLQVQPKINQVNNTAQKNVTEKKATSAVSSKVTEVKSKKVSGKSEGPETPDNLEKPAKLEVSEKSEKAEKPEKLEKVGKKEKSEKVEKPEKEKPEESEKPEKPEKAEKVENEKEAVKDKTIKQTKVDKPEKSENSEKSNPEKPEIINNLKPETKTLTIPTSNAISSISPTVSTPTVSTSTIGGGNQTPMRLTPTMMLTPTSETLASIGLNVSTTIFSPCRDLTSDRTSNNYKSAPKSNSEMKTTTTLGKEIAVSSISSASPCSSPRFNIQTPSMSIYSIPTTMKNNTYPSSPSPKQSAPKSNLEITSVYSVPPCPDAIPISLMKPNIARKNDILAKSTNLNEICAKIGSTQNVSTGSKINDICAKIGENSREKSKAEQLRNQRPEIPDLLKISKESLVEPVMKHIPNIPNVPIYTPSQSHNDLGKDGKRPPPYPGQQHQDIHGQKVPMNSRHSQPMRYKTLRDPPKSWNPTLSKNDYVAAKNQAQAYAADHKPSIPLKPAKIFKNRNMLRCLGNPTTGVKPMYGMVSDVPEKETPPAPSAKSPVLSMMKIDPQTLSPIISSSNSPIVSPPPYSPRSYQNSPFSRDICRSSGAQMSPARNSPVNMPGLSTNPFIPSPTPNTNPRLIYSEFPPPYPDASRFPNPLIRTPIGIPPPSAFHSRLPPSVNKMVHRSSYLPTYSQSVAGQPPTIQRIPPSNLPKSSKASSMNLMKGEAVTTTSSIVDNVALHLAKSIAQRDPSVYDLLRPENQVKSTEHSRYKMTDAKPKTANWDSANARLASGKNEGESEGKKISISDLKSPTKDDKKDKTPPKVNGGVNLKSSLEGIKRQIDMAEKRKNESAEKTDNSNENSVSIGNKCSKTREVKNDDSKTEEVRSQKVEAETNKSTGQGNKLQVQKSKAET